MTGTHALARACIAVVFPLLCTPTLMADKPELAPIENESLLKALRSTSIPNLSLPGNETAFLKMLRAKGPRCRAPEYFGMQAFYTICKDSLLTALVSLKNPSDEALAATLDWYWSSKSRISVNEAVQKRLFNQLRSPALDAILMEKRYLQSAMEFSNIQYRLNPEARKYWDLVPARKNNLSIEELFQLTYDLPTLARAYASGYINQERIFGSVERTLGKHTELNRLIDHVLDFTGADTDRLSRKKSPRIPNNSAFWDTLDAVHKQPSSSVALENKLKQLSDIYGHWLQLSPRVEDMARPGQGKIFIEYIFYRNDQTGLDHYAAFSFSTTGPGTSIRFSDLGPAATITRLVAKLRQAILHKTSTRKEQQQLAALLIEPLKISSRSSDELVISPEGVLNSLPFSLLTSEERENPVIVTYNDSWSILMQQFWRQAHLNQPVATTPGVILAAPDYGGDLKTVSADLNVAGQERNGSDAWPRFFAPLTYTKLEGKNIERLSPDKVVYLTGKQASEFALFERNNPKFVHIASHGYFLSDHWQRKNRKRFDARKADPWYQINPWVLPQLNSGLALSGANQLAVGEEVEAFRQDGLFTVTDAASLNLLGTELVVLSACDTGLGSGLNEQLFVGVGDGASNLRIAFRHAGARNVIMSLWPVADKATWWFMEEFYTAWFSGTPPKMALGQARTRLRERLRKHSMDDHPYYWAGFVIQSEF